MTRVLHLWAARIHLCSMLTAAGRDKPAPATTWPGDGYPTGCALQLLISCCTTVMARGEWLALAEL
jgi:hypothetical protein